MARQNRVQIVGIPFHVWARRVDRSPLFRDEEDYRRYIAILAATVADFGWILLSFCLMPNHIHILVELREENLPNGMHALHQSYVTYFNRKYGRQGRLFEHRYKSKPVADEVYFATLLQYIEQNPVRGGLCATPEAWPWSSRGIVARGGAAWVADAQLSEERTKLKDGACPRL